jgi:hypothetical protein
MRRGSIKRATTVETVHAAMKLMKEENKSSGRKKVGHISGS